MEYWKHVKNSFNRDYGLIYMHYIEIPTIYFDDVAMFRHKWYTTRAYMRMVRNNTSSFMESSCEYTETNYDEYKTKYEELFNMYPNHAEPIYELCQSSPSVKERYELYKKCLACTIEVDDSEVLEWKALCGFLVECYNLEKYDEAYDAWVKLQKGGNLEKIRDKYRDWIVHVKKCGMLVTEKIKEISSYAQFRSELRKIKMIPTKSESFVTSCSSNSNMNVPKSVHNIHLVWVKGYREYSIIQYLAVRAAYELHIRFSSYFERNFINSACNAELKSLKEIFIYNDVEPENNEWWEKTKEYASIVHITPPKYINGKHIPHPQHVADIMRICIIYEFGGMYIDTDLLLIKNVSELIKSLDKYTFSSYAHVNALNPKDSEFKLPEREFKSACSAEFSNLIMCKETDNKIWNGLIIAKPHNSFLKRWIREYETKYGNSEGGCWWAGLSVETPMRLYKEDCTDIVLLNTHTFLPFGFYDDGIYKEEYRAHDNTNSYPLSYGVHLWETEAEKRGVLPKNKEWFELHKDAIFTHLFGKYL
jgi:hypothetical protein